MHRIAMADSNRDSIRLPTSPSPLELFHRIRKNSEQPEVNGDHFFPGRSARLMPLAKYSTSCDPSLYVLLHCGDLHQ
jgi:hypothetical protein